MFNPFSVVTTARELEKLLQSGHKEDGDARDALLNILKSSGYRSVTPELREVLAFSIGYFSKCLGQGGVVEEMASTYSALCANIANGHVSI